MKRSMVCLLVLSFYAGVQAGDGADRDKKMMAAENEGVSLVTLLSKTELDERLEGCSSELSYFTENVSITKDLAGDTLDVLTLSQKVMVSLQEFERTTQQEFTNLEACHQEFLGRILKGYPNALKHLQKKGVISSQSSINFAGNPKIISKKNE